MKKEKEVCYFLQKTGSSDTELSRQKKQRSKQGYRVVTIIEGKEEMQQGLFEILRNHLQ